MDVIADIVLNPVFDPREIEVERHVILQEIGQAHDTPDDIIFDWLQEAGLHVVLDMHQDLWGPIYEGGGHGSDGAPPWATITEGEPEILTQIEGSH